MGTQKDIVSSIRRKKADYVLALKGNQGSLHEDNEHLKGCAYTRTLEKARGGVEKREYWQTEDIKWLASKKEWTGLKSIAMTKNTIERDGEITVEVRYFISSLQENIDEVAHAIRGHWMVESYHWHLDATFKEDNNATLDKEASYNLNIIRKLAINTLKLIEVRDKKVSLKGKRYIISLNPIKYLEKYLTI